MILLVQLPRDDQICYCGLFLDEVSAENCVECQHWDECEYVMAMVIPDLLERMLDWQMHGALASHDVVRNVIVRLKGEHYVSA